MSVDFNASFSGSAETFGAKMTEMPAPMTASMKETDGNSDAFIKNKPAIPKAVTKTVQTLSDAASKSFTVTGYILSVILIDSATKEQVIGDVSFENATASANGKVTVTLAAAPSNPILVIITSIAL